MFTETIIAAFLLGAIVGGTYIWVMCFRPVAEQLRTMEYRNLRTERQRLYRAEHRRQHQGTPYIAQPGNATARTFEYLLNDNDRWSRKAPANLPDNVRAIGGEQ